MIKNPSLALDEIRTLLHYDPTTGVFRWKVGRGPGRVGSVAGHAGHDGYWRLCLSGQRVLAHRAAWFYVHGYWPPSQIDHINTDRTDNRIINLRLADRYENSRNTPCGKNNTSGFKGVSWVEQRKKWLAKICAGRKQKYLGLFRTKEEAHAAYCAAAVRLHGDFARFS